MWTCVVLTCCDPRWAKALREELTILKEQKLINPELLCLVLEDPSGTVGSGGATLNALLVTVEKLCSIQGHLAVTADVLKGANILIVHQGRNSCFWSNGKIFLPVENERSDSSGLKTYLESIIGFCSQLKENAPSGVWVASADMMLHGTLENNFNWSSANPDALLLAVPCRKIDADYCGIVEMDANGTVSEILYNSNDGNSMEEVNIVGGIVYLKTEVAEIMLSLSNMTDLDSCTYVGSDSGDKAQQLSLYFDLLGPLCSGFDKSKFLSGDYSSSYERIFGNYSEEVNRQKYKPRSLIWEQLNSFKLTAFIAQGLRQCYWTDRLSVEQILGNVHHASIMQPAKVLHSFAKYPKASLICANSTIETNIDLENQKDLIIISSSIAGNQRLNLRGKAFIISAQLNIDEVPEFYLGDNHCLIGYCIRTKENELKEGRAVFSASDIPLLDRNHPLATVFGMSWDRYLELKGISSDDLWDSEYQSLSTAKLYPLTEDLTSWRNFLWLQECSGTLDSLQRLESWRISKRYSMADFIQLSDPVSALRQYRQTVSTVVCRSISEWQGSLLPYLRRACAENWSNTMFQALDRIAAREEAGVKVSRALMAIADLLGTLAGPEGRLRSGPASNKEWLHAFYLLENVSVEEGVYALASQRAKWMDTPERLIRAARHYEKAVNIMIRQVVKGIQKPKIDLTGAARPSFGHWVETECAARIDFAGGWSDNPPICYEMGGAAVNMAVLINGKKPIGARGKRLEQFKLVLSSDQFEPLIITSLDDVMNYNNPSAPGALLKVALVCAGVVRKDSKLDFKQQLLETLGGGLELQSWSLLPQGSGLGTSSILASALFAVIYTCMGIPFNRTDLVNAVLYAEQLLTSGAGWQDPVGGIVGGCKYIHSPAGSSIRVQIEPLPLAESFAANINQNLLLIHTGKVRLGRNLLQNVIRQWYARDESILAIFRSLTDNSAKCRRALIDGNLPEVGRAIDMYWSQKRTLAPGSEPQFVRELMDRMAPHVYGQSLAGAGGGGFYFALLKENSDRTLIEDIVFSVKGIDKMSVHSATMDRTGITMQINKQPVDISV